MTAPHVDIAHFVRDFAASPLARWADGEPWRLTAQSADIVRRLLGDVASNADFVIADEMAIHRTAVVERGAVLKGPLIVGAGCLVAAGAYLRGGSVRRTMLCDQSRE